MRNGNQTRNTPRTSRAPVPQTAPPDPPDMDPHSGGVRSAHAPSADTQKSMARISLIAREVMQEADAAGKPVTDGVALLYAVAIWRDQRERERFAYLLQQVEQIIWRDAS